MRPPLLSVLVPCFNVEKYVGECLESIRRQTFTDFEVLMLNDGSPDGTLGILQDFASRDTRFRVIDKPNSGYGATLNQGLSEALGTYVAIIESDDFIEPDMFARLIKEALAKHLDISGGCFSRLVNGKNYYDPCKFFPKSRVFRPRTEPNAFRHPPSVWSAVYRKAFLDENGIRFRETPGASFQDISFAFKANLAAERVHYLDTSFVHYRIHGMNSVKRPTNAHVVFGEYDECIRYAKERGQYDSVRPLMLRIEYATHKWNYLRVNRESAEAFFDAWRMRWREHREDLPRENSVEALYAFLLENAPSVFKRYLESKRK